MTRAEWARRSGRSSKWIARATRLAIYLRDGFRCTWCGRNLAGARPCDLALDHLRPQSLGGSNRPTNLVTVCRRCNSQRQDRRWRAWLLALHGEAHQVLVDAIVRDVERRRRRRLNRALARDLVARQAPGPAPASEMADPTCAVS